MGAAEKLDYSLPFPPAGMNRAMALAYTGVGEAQLKEWERRGIVRFKARGRRGEMIALRTDLDAALTTLFAGPSEDMDFGD